ncbi:hypothetical protein AURDEDRAFT_84813, partial [Auricularia subglabra TFB-10046 SS5]
MPVTTLNGPPPFTTPEQHAQLTASTPESFESIPPILRHLEQAVVLSLDPPLDGVQCTEARGALYVTERVVAFVPADGSAGFSVDYPTLILHAISRSEDGPLLYCQLDESIGVEGAEEDDDVDTTREIKIVPASPEALEPIFEAISLCASLNADPVDEDDEDEAFLDADEDQEELSEVGRAALAHLESIIDWDHPASKPRPQTNGASHDEDSKDSDEKTEAPITSNAS